MDRYPNQGPGGYGYGEQPHDRPPYQGEERGNYGPPGQGNYGRPEGEYYGGNQQYPQNPNYGGNEQYPPNPNYGQQSSQYNNNNNNYENRSEYGGYAGPGQQYGQGQGQGQYPQGGEDGDRGIMGALAGGAAGAWGGHKMHHGVLGTIGGAIAGSMLEDAAKKHHHREQEHEHGYQHRGFRASCHDVRLENHCILVAECETTRGHHHRDRSEINLNDCLTNVNGRLMWERNGNFAASARRIRLKHDENVLEVECGDGRGGWVDNEIDLNERIANENGRLVMI